MAVCNEGVPHRHHRPSGQGSKRASGRQLVRQRGSEDDGDHLLRAGGHRAGLHPPAGAEEEEEGTEAQETER